MANKHLFSSLVPQHRPAANATNDAGGAAYAMSAAHALAQLASTGAFRHTFYASAELELARVLELAREVDLETVAKTAVYARQRGFMKDMPALLLALVSKDPVLLQRAFPKVVDDAKMLRLFVQMLRSGAAGRRSLGTRPKKLVQAWLDARTDAQVFAASVGADPSLAVVIKLAHPSPKTPQRKALYAYLIGAPHDAKDLPEIVAQYEAFKAGTRLEVPEVPFAMLTSLPLSQKDWAAIAKRATWTQLRMNLNTFVRQGVFAEPGLIELVAARLRDPVEVRKARVFPYQLLTAYKATKGLVPAELTEALHDAMEHALVNVPRLEGGVHVLVDVSGSMSSPVTGQLRGATTVTRCVDVAALIGAAILRVNKSAKVLAFEHRVVDVTLEPRDTVMTNAQRLAAVGGGGTSCSAPLVRLNETNAKGDLVIFVSDNESWLDARGGRSTAVLHEWNRYRARNPHAKLVCIDLVPNTTMQAPDRADILHVGGFSDAVFDSIAAFHASSNEPARWLNEIRAIDLAA